MNIPLTCTIVNVLRGWSILLVSDSDAGEIIESRGYRKVFKFGGRMHEIHWFWKILGLGKYIYISCDIKFMFTGPHHWHKIIQTREIKDMGLTILLSVQNGTFYFLSASKHVATEGPCLKRNLRLDKNCVTWNSYCTRSHTCTEIPNLHIHKPKIVVVETVLVIFV